MSQTASRLTNEELLGILALSKDATAIYTTENMIIELANDAMIRYWGKDRSVVGQPLESAVPELVGQPFADLLRKVWKTGKDYEARDIAARLRVNDSLQWYFFDFVYRAIKDAKGDVICILHTATDVTERNVSRLVEGKMKRREEGSTPPTEATDFKLANTTKELYETRQELDNLMESFNLRLHETTRDHAKARTEAEIQRGRFTRFLMQAPAGICILDGPDMVFELVNPMYAQLFPGRDLVGKPLLEALPELKDGPIWELLQEVFRTGRSFEGHELLVPLARTPGGPIEERYFNFIYQARLEMDGSIDGIMVFVIEVTDSVVSKKRIEESEADLRSLVTTTHYALLILKGRDWIIEIANQELANLWNRKLPDFVGMKLMDVLPELKDQPFPALLKQVYDTGVAYGQEEEVLFLDLPEGKVQKYVSFFYDPMFDKRGEVIGIIVGANDITEQAHARKMLEESNERQRQLNKELSDTQREYQLLIDRLSLSEDRLRSVISNAPFPIAVYEGKEKYISVANQSIIDVWGKGNDVIGKSYHEILPELEAQSIFAQLEQVYDTGIPFNARNQMVRLLRKGVMQPFYFNYSFTPLYDVNGKIFGVMNTAADVTDLVVAMQKVEQNEQTLHNMILQAPVAMCILWGPKHVITVANELIIDLWGKTSDEVMNKPVFDALPDARNQGLEQLMADVYERGITFTANERPVDLLRNGRLETVYQNFVYQPYRHVDGSIQGVIAITIDVTEQVLARLKLEKSEAELLEIKKRLEQELEIGKLVQRQKDDFIGIASHELKTPLTSLTAIVQLLNRKLGDSEDAFVSGALEKATTQVKKMSNLINGFLNISRIESGKMYLHKQRFSFEELLQEVVNEVQLTTQDHVIQVAGCESTEVFADREKIGSVISNLLSNAVKYSPESRHIEVNCSWRGDFLQVSIYDEGIGVREQDLEKLFDRYYRVESIHTKHISGFGIGLYLSSEIVKQHQGRIWTERNVGKGSTFYFTIPLAKE